MGLSRGPPADLLTRSLELERVSNDQPDDLLGDRDHRLLVSRLPRLGIRRRVQPLRLGGTRGGASGGRLQTPRPKRAYRGALRGCALPRRSPAGMPREWAERSYSDLRRFTRMPRGGHVPAMEEPEFLTEDIRSFLRPLR
jgi:pimeloyl-ACP methyl ester carboxylesterase